MIKFRGILSTSNVIVLMIMATGNLVFGILQNHQEWQEMECVHQAIYHNSTETTFLNCLLDTKLFDGSVVTWVCVQFILITISILVVYLIETIKNKR